MVSALLCGAIGLTVPVAAQDSAGIIEQRIDSVFKIVPQNAAELAIPLTRRALARRSAGDDVAPLAYFPTSAPASVQVPVEEATTFAAKIPDAEEEKGDLPLEPSEGDLEQGSLDDNPELDEQIARLPRSRPGGADEASEASQPVAVGEPLAPEAAVDLVASAAPENIQARASASSLSEPPAASTAPMPAAGPPPAEVGEPAPGTARPVAEAAAQPPQPSVTASLRTAALSPGSRQDALRAQDIAVASPPREDCLAADKLADSDGDFARNAAALDEPGFCLAQQKFKERRRPWTVQTVHSGRPGPLWAVLHDDEDVAFDSAVTGLNTYGGVLFTVDTGGKRNQDGIDPNRNFSDERISCPKLGDAASPRFTGAFAELIDPGLPIIALHSNFNGRVPTTGIGHVSMSTVPKKMRVAKSSDPEGPLASEHALVLLAAPEPVSEAVDLLMEQLSGKGVNVVLETVSKTGDCSLSNYAVLSGHSGYFNVTVDHDEADKQKRIIEAILSSGAMVAAAR